MGAVEDTKAADDALREFGINPDSATADAALAEFGVTPEGLPVYRTTHTETTPNAFGRLLEGAWKNLNPVPAAKSLLGLLTHSGFGTPGQLSPEMMQAIQGLYESHADQFEKARSAWGKGEHTESAGHMAAALLPFLGPVAAAAGERIGGTDPVLDKYGAVVTPGEKPDVWGGIGEGLGLVAPMGATELLARSKASIPVIPKLENPNPVKAGVVQWGLQNDIPVPVGPATGNPALRTIQKAAEHSLTGSWAAGESKQALADSMTRMGENLAGRASRAAVVPETAGAAAEAGVEDVVKQLRQSADLDYSEFHDVASKDPANFRKVQTGTHTETGFDPNTYEPVTRTSPVMENISMPVNIRNIKEVMREQYESLTKWASSLSRESSEGFAALQTLMTGPDVVSASEAERGLSGLKQLARDAANENLRNVSQGIAANAAGELQAEIDAAVRRTGGQKTLDILKQARRTYAEKMEAGEVLKKFGTEPVQTFNQLTWAHDAGIERLRSVAKIAPQEMPKLGRGWVEKMMDMATSEGGFKKGEGLWSQWEKLGPETKKLLFKDPALRQDLENFFHLGKELAHLTNPSGSGIAAHSLAQGAWIFAHPLTGVPYALATGALTKALFSPGVSKALTQGMRLYLNKTAPAAVRGLALNQILKALGPGGSQQLNAPAERIGLLPQSVPQGVPVPQ